MDSTAKGILTLVICGLIFILSMFYMSTKEPEVDKHLYGSTCIDTTCWNKNDQLHYILKETRLELKQCNFLTQELADSIKNLHALYGEWILEYEQELEQIGYYDGDNDILSKYNNDDNRYNRRLYKHETVNQKPYFIVNPNDN